MLALCDELTRSGELFPVLSTNPLDGMSYVRSVPARQIDAIQTQDGDYETALVFHQVDPRIQAVGRDWVSFDNPDRALVGASAQVMLHLAINRPVGATRGQRRSRSDLEVAEALQRLPGSTAGAEPARLGVCV